MRRVTIKGLLAHKLRFALTALAVMLGVSFMSGTMILTDTISRTFDNLFADVNRGTDAYVRSAQSLSSGFGGPVRRQRARVPASLVPEIESVPGAAAARMRSFSSERCTMRRTNTTDSLGYACGHYFPKFLKLRQSVDAGWRPPR